VAGVYLMEWNQGLPEAMERRKFPKSAGGFKVTQLHHSGTEGGQGLALRGGLFEIWV